VNAGEAAKQVGMVGDQVVTKEHLGASRRARVGPIGIRSVERGPVSVDGQGRTKSISPTRLGG
jgi:hypothetical protein